MESHFRFKKKPGFIFFFFFFLVEKILGSPLIVFRRNGLLLAETAAMEAQIPDCQAARSQVGYCLLYPRRRHVVPATAGEPRASIGPAFVSNFIMGLNKCGLNTL
jgi:hypothetical protein